MIVIKTPQPDIEERLVLVPVRRIVPESRDATPDDLARAGYVPLAAFVGPLDLLTPPTLAGALQVIESIQNDADAAQDRAEKAERALRCQCSEPGDSPCRVHDEERADAAERNLSAALERAERAERERDEARSRVGVDVVDALARLREESADNAKLRAELARLTAPVEVEPTDEALGCIAREAGPYRDLLGAASYRALYRLGVAHERARQQPAQGRATDEELVGEAVAEGVSSLLAGALKDRDRASARALLAEAQRDEARRQRDIWRTKATEPRATDEELLGVYRDARDKLHYRDEQERAGVAALAARVRGERCLVAQAVARSWYLYLCPQKNEPSKWDIETGRVIAGRSDGGAILHGVPAADVPATLARLLGEVSRG